ncbi:MAG: hypothetical protein AAB833_02270 [Patescibacteria group bacterium]
MSEKGPGAEHEIRKGLTLNPMARDLLEQKRQQYANRVLVEVVDAKLKAPEMTLYWSKNLDSLAKLLLTEQLLKGSCDWQQLEASMETALNNIGCKVIFTFRADLVKVALNNAWGVIDAYNEKRFDLLRDSQSTK